MVREHIVNYNLLKIVENCCLILHMRNLAKYSTCTRKCVLWTVLVNSSTYTNQWLCYLNLLNIYRFSVACSLSSQGSYGKIYHYYEYLFLLLVLLIFALFKFVAITRGLQTQNCSHLSAELTLLWLWKLYLY